MEISIKISDYTIEQQIIKEITQSIHKKVDERFEQVFQNIKIEDLILKRVDYLIDKSKYVSDTIIRNLVQQRIAKEITSDIIGKL